MADAEPVSTDPAYMNYNPGWKSEGPPFDARFPHQNQYANCIRNYADYHRCRKIKGEDYVNCNYFKKVYMRKCPPHFVRKFDDQIERDAFQYQL